MSAFYNQIVLTWQDDNGKQAISIIPAVDQSEGPAADYEVLAAAFDDVADAKIVCVQFQSTLKRVVTPSTGAYSTVWDRGVLFDRNSETQAFQRQAIVGPKADIFEGDTITINLTDSRILALQGVMMTLCGDGAGNPIGPYQRGKRQTAGGS